jgi:hypothetical protein
VGKERNVYYTDDGDISETEPWVDEEQVCPDDSTSSVIKQIEYNWPACKMRVTFQTGKVYIYEAVSSRDYIKFVEAESKGRHFNEFIKGNFNFLKERA